MSSAFDNLMAALKLEEDRLVKGISTDRIGFFPVYTLREYDSFYTIYKTGDLKIPNADVDELYYFLRLGAPRALAHALSSCEKYEVPTLMPVHDETIAARARETLVRLGRIEHGRRLAVASKIGEVELRQKSETSFEFTLPRNWIDHDSYEESVRRHFAEQGKRWYYEQLGELDARNLEDEIEYLACENVFVFNDRFIGYDAHPFLDDHFFRLAYLHISLLAGFDSFKFEVTFGGVPYIRYVLAVVYIYSLALKHEKYCDELARKHPDINPKNILTTSSEKSIFIETIGEALNMYGPHFKAFSFSKREELEKIYRVLSVRRDNVGVLKPNGAPMPMLFEFSDTSVYLSLAGAQENPIQVLLNGLRHHFPDDYNANQQRREESVQRALEGYLQGSFGKLVFKRNVMLRRNGQDLTDVDLSVADETSNAVLLFQIKAQDSYGSELSSRINRSLRFVKESRKWVSATQGWLSEASPADVRNRFGMNHSSDPPKVYLVVLSRHFAHFGLSEETPENVTYCTWDQFYNAIVKSESRQGQMRTIESLFAWIVRDEIRRNATPSKFPEKTFSLQSVEFSTSNQLPEIAHQS